MVRGIPYNPNDHIGKNIRRWRGVRGLSQRQLAKKSGISDRSITKWETGAGGMSMTNAHKIAVALDIDIEALLKESS